MTETLREYPNLPLLTMAQCVATYKIAGLGAATLASLTGMSRVSTTRWLKGSDVKANNATLNTANALTYKVLRAIRHKKLAPVTPKIKPRLAALQVVLADAAYDTPLTGYRAEELLPKTWLDNLANPRHDRTS